MKDKQFRVLLDLMMVSDPWPLGQTDLAIFKGFMLNESLRRGYDNTTEAFKNFRGPRELPTPKRIVTADDGDGGTVELVVTKRNKRKPRKVRGKTE